jgi:tetratricopeptide (TPR) repeat protein
MQVCRVMRDLVPLVWAAALWLIAPAPSFAESRRDYERCTNDGDTYEPDEAIASCSEIIVVTRVLRNNIRMLAQLNHNRGRAHAARGNYSAAIADYTTAVGLSPYLYQSFNNRGLARYHSQDYAGAITDFAEALRINPRHARAQHNRALARQASGDLAGAILDSNDAISLEPGNAIFLHTRCRFQALANQDMDAALADCEASLAAVDTPDARESRGIFYLRRGEWARARDDFDTALSAEPNRPYALYGRGVARLHLGETVQADADRNQALASDPIVARDFAQFE